MRKFFTKTLHLETPMRPPLLHLLRMITVQAAVAGGVRCSWSQAGIVGLYFPAKNNKCIVEHIVSWTMHRETYCIVTKAYNFTPNIVRHDTAMMWNAFCITIADPLWGESTGDQWIPLTKGSNAELFLDARLCKLINKQCSDLWFETLTFMWCHRNA